ncbi:MAG: hypothetical protein WC762_05115 [Methylobacter sp.]|jgi:hypothetical protein
MPKKFGILMAAILFPMQMAHAEDCSEAFTSADDVYSFAEDSLRSHNLHDVRDNAGQANEAAEDMVLAADECSCDEASEHADDAFSYTERAYQAHKLNKAISYMKLAGAAADEAMSALEECEI